MGRDALPAPGDYGRGVGLSRWAVAVTPRRVMSRAVPVGVVLLLVACGPVGGAPAPTVSAAPTASRTSTAAPTSPASSATAPDAVTVRDTGMPLGEAAHAGPAAGSLLPVAGAAVQVVDQMDGSVLLTLDGPPGVLAWAAPPQGGRAEVQADGSVTLHDEAGTVAAAVDAPVAADGSRGRWRAQGEVLALEGPTGAVSFVVGSAALEGATWGDAEGGRSLAVVPAGWVRRGSLAAQHALASQLAGAEPEAASASMQAQLWCHVLGAPDKASWNIEPWRPEVSTTTMLTTRCNPTPSPTPPARGHSSPSRPGGGAAAP